MSNLTNSRLRKMIMRELAKMVDEDALITPSEKDAYRDTGYNPQYKSIDMDSFDDYGGAVSTCEQCGGMAYEGECMESDCGSSRKGSSMLQEGDCGCGGSSSDGTDYSIDTMMEPVYGMGATSMHIDFPNHGGIQHHGHNNYMAKPALYKVAKYAQKLLHMIPDGYELDDWQRHKIAQISDDISEVYHSLDYDFYDDEH